MTYRFVKAPKGFPGSVNSKGYAREHVVVFWQTHGRLPKPGHLVHHKDEDKQNNDPMNLEEQLRGQHTVEHRLAMPWKHGSDSTYGRGCRCADCKAAHTVASREYRARMRAA